MPMIAEAWASYLREVVPTDAPDVQRVECRLAFYAGCQAMYALLVADLPDDEAEAEMHLRDLNEELGVFLREVQHRAGNVCCSKHPEHPSVFCMRRPDHGGLHRNANREWV